MFPQYDENLLRDIGEPATSISAVVVIVVYIPKKHIVSDTQREGKRYDGD